jgi:predicted MFS family arabinose efflux permease
MAEYGWRMGYVALALIPLFVAGPIVFTFFRPAPIASETDPSSATQSWGLTLSDAMKRYRFWVLLGSIFLVYIAQSGLVPNLIPALTDTGISPTDAAQTMSLFGAAVIIGRLTIGFCVDRFWAPGVAAVALLLPVIGCFLLWQDLTLTNARIAAVLLGFAAGAELDLMAFLAATYFGPRHYPKIYGVLYAALASASGIAPALFAEIYEQTQSYTIGFATGAAAFTVAVILVLMLGRYPSEAKTTP